MLVWVDEAGRDILVVLHLDVKGMAVSGLTKSSSHGVVFSSRRLGLVNQSGVFVTVELVERNRVEGLATETAYEEYEVAEACPGCKRQRDCRDRSFRRAIRQPTLHKRGDGETEQRRRLERGCDVQKALRQCFEAV